MQIKLNTMQFLHKPRGADFLLLWPCFWLTLYLSFCIISLVADLGAWCNGNTWVSKTFVEGSNPSAPADKQNPADIKPAGFFFCIGGNCFLLALGTTLGTTTHQGTILPLSVPLQWLRSLHPLYAVAPSRRGVYRYPRSCLSWNAPGVQTLPSHHSRQRSVKKHQCGGGCKEAHPSAHTAAVSLSIYGSV